MPAEPFPRQPFSKTADGSGNAVIPFNAPSNFYLHCYIALSASAGSPTYAVDLGGSAIPLVYGQGNQAQLGPVFLQPGEQARIVVAGASAGATVSGQVLGWQSRAPSELLPLLPIQPTAITIAGAVVSTPASGQIVSAGSAAGAAASFILAPSTGQFAYVTGFKIQRFASALLVAAAAPVNITFTGFGFAGNVVLLMPADAAAQGTVWNDTVPIAQPVHSVAAGTSVTCTAPATPNVIWGMAATYYYGP